MTEDIISIIPRIDAEVHLGLLDSILRGYRFNFTNEKQLQSGIALAFAALETPPVREHRLSDEDIIDFYWPDKKIGVEVKIGDTLANLTRQVHRYLQHEDLLGILVVVSKTKLTGLPEAISHKPVRMHSLITSIF